MQAYTNGTGVPLSLAVFLATDNYDHDPNTISATALLKPLRQIILSRRVPPELNKVDVVSLFKSRMGTALHDAIEKAWTGNFANAMKSLGYSDNLIERIVVNPTEPLADDAIPVYMEQRAYREILGKTVSGKYDIVAEGRLEDFKSTTVYTWINGTKDKDYQLQGSIYRWLSPEIITQDHMAIQFLFTDWMPGRAGTDPKYPNRPVEQKLIPLLTLEETEGFITNKLTQFAQHKDSPESALPLCTDEELWRRAPKYKYYKNPTKLSRSTKNFDTKAEAYGRLTADGGVGVVVEVPGTVMACNYCAAFPICTQKDQLIADGSLIV